MSAIKSQHTYTPRTYTQLPTFSTFSVFPFVLSFLVLVACAPTQLVYARPCHEQPADTHHNCPHGYTSIHAYTCTHIHTYTHMHTTAAHKIDKIMHTHHQ